MRVFVWLNPPFEDSLVYIYDLPSGKENPIPIKQETGEWASPRAGLGDLEQT